MSYFAKVDGGIVLKIIRAELEFFDTFMDTTPGTWIQTSYNTKGNVHYDENGIPDGKPALRANYAGVGYFYDASNDVFYSPQPFKSWILNKNSWVWEAPVLYPNDGETYSWNESALAWEKV